MRNFIGLILLALTLSGCSRNELNRDIAYKLLSNDIGYPIIEFGGCTWSDYVFQSYKKYEVYNLAGKKVEIKGLIDMGYMSISNGYRTTGSLFQQRQSPTYEYKLTEISSRLLKTSDGLTKYNGNPFAEFPIHFIEIGEITGIKFENETKTEATIEYTEKTVATSPFIILNGINERKAIENKTAKATLYDDGWRIEKINSLRFGNMYTKSEGDDNYLSYKDFPQGESLFFGDNQDYMNNLKQVMSEITVETSTSPCLIKNFYEKNGYTLITVDYITFDVDEDEYGITRKIISNTNPKLRTFIFEESTIIGPKGFINDKSDIQKNLACDDCIWFINVVDGRIKNLDMDTAG